ncbi:hypothetical protein CANCADRAFT_23198 [Tortispora caseinolytica NRRL Y-17796]|uniref:Serine/threonine-protein kinase TEL1 n=1 Tax=Tortispora caseinolytica NRRL Y-17796 TaxID=767744 RepID=A0A1E4TMF2_9ASCO|nr:hypothetical protein CANCADRAFT_23198 [Tortispora caseinolytica NRRL Y-17796]
MQQVFGYVNRRIERESNIRKAINPILTYEVVPLGQTAGLIEYVDNTVSLLDLIEDLRKKHSSNKFSRSKGIAKLKAAMHKDRDTKKAVFCEIQREINPVMRYFFVEYAKTPEEWFQRRISYSRGTATMCMVGYVLGIGDRHCNNILIDKVSGGPVPIDFGIAFDYGKYLPIPEVVPFRLTKNIIDGMGVTGIEGPFRLSAERSLKVLRSNRDNILSILKALQYDPLYSWSISSLRMHNVQQDLNKVDAENRIKALGGVASADNALLTVKKKLYGDLKIETIVSKLITEATDEYNLSMMFSGWLPFY